MGSKGSNTTTQSGQSSYSADPRTQGAASQALGMAQTAASSPFQLPVAPVAGFTPDQAQAFQQNRNIQGMAQPYYDQSQGLFNQSAAPISGSQVNNYLNPYAGYVMANLQEQQGQQMHDLTGRATQAAGGVGADRIGVAQGELARQQSLASGQTLSGIYGSALSAAQQDAQRQQSAAYGIGNLGGAAQNAALQGTQALYGQGAQQQQLNQAQLNAPYQNQLAQLAFPYQNAQFLAGVTGNVAPSLGGTTYSNQTTTGPPPSLFSQLAGAGTAAAGAYGAYNSLGSGGGGYGDGSWYGPSSVGGRPLAASGGRIGYADGGGIPGGGGTDWMHSDPTIPQMSMQTPQMHYPEVHFSNPSGGGGDSTLKDIGNIASAAAKLAPMFLAQGGAVGPSPYQGYADGGPTFDDRFSGETKASPWEFFKAGAQDFAGDARAAVSGQMRGPSLDNRRALWDRDRRNHYADGGETQDYVPQDFNSRFVDPAQGELPYAPNFDQRFNAATSPTQPFTPPTGSPGNPYRMPDVKADGSPIVPASDDSDIPASANATRGMQPSKVLVTGGEEEPLSPAANRTAADNTKSMSGQKFEVPYDNNPSEDESRRWAKSPWLALMNAGFGMMAGTSPFAGVNIGKGLQEGVKTLESQRKDLMTEEGVNQRAKQLALEAQKHLDQYTKLTPKEAADIENKQAALELIKGVKVFENPIDGTSIWEKGGKITKYGPNGPMPLTPADSAIIASKGGNGLKVADASGAVPADHPSSEGEPANTAISPPGGVVSNADPQSMLGSAASPSQAAERNNDALQGYGTKGAAQLARAASNAERKDVVKAATGADRSQFRLQEMKRDLDTIMAYVNKKPDGLAEQALQAAIKPGPGAETAANLSNWLSKFGTGLPPEVLAAAQTWGKNATLAGFAGIVGEGLSAREAMPIIRASMGAVASISLPEASNRALIASGQELAQRAKDKQNFLDSYLIKNGGISTGWAEQFEKRFPIGSYIARAVVSSLPPVQREKLNDDTRLLRERRDQYMAAEKSGDSAAIGAARDKYMNVKRGFDGRYGGTADYFAFGRM